MVHFDLCKSIAGGHANLQHQMTCDSNKQTKKRDLVLHLFVWTYELLRRGLRRTLTYNDVLQNGFRVNPVWLIREKVMSASRNNLLL